MRNLFVKINQGELSSVTTNDSHSLSSDVATWNPFEDVQPFNQLTEDHIFGAEFDKIRRGSSSSISGVKSRESLVMAYTDVPVDDPFESAPFKLPSELNLIIYWIMHLAIHSLFYFWFFFELYWLNIIRLKSAC